MKKIIYISLLVTISVLWSCYNDESSNGNSDKIENIQIDSILPSYTVHAFIDTIDIKPIISSNLDSDWDYKWQYYITTATAIESVKFIDICDSKDLHLTFDLEPNRYILVFSAHNKKTGVTQYAKSTLNVITGFSNGWYVLKDDGTTNADFDHFLSDDNAFPKKPYQRNENILKMVNGESLNGIAKKFQLTTNMKLDNKSGDFVYTRAFMVLTDKDLGVYTISEMEKKRGVDNIFYDITPSIKPNSIYETPFCILFVNDGKMYAQSTKYGNSIGQFNEAASMGGSSSTPYRLSDFMAYGNTANNVLAFDELSQSFVLVSTYGGVSYCMDFPIPGFSDMSPINTGMNLIYMGPSNSNAIAVLENETTKDRTIISLTKSASPVVKIISNISAGSTDKIATASKMTVANEESVMFFVDQNGDIWSHLLNAVGTETMEYDVPSDETVAFIRQIRSNAQPQINYIAVATTKNSGSSTTYKIRFFQRLAGHFTEEKTDMLLEGNGYPRDVNHLSTSQTEQTINFSCIYL